MAPLRASLPEKRPRSRLLLPALFVAFAAVGSALGLGVPVPKAWSERTASAAMAPGGGPKSAGVRPDEHPEPLDLALVKTPTAFPRLNPETSVARAWLLAEGPEPVPHDGRRYVTFTFDDGPFVETTPAILRVLAQRRLHATFFVVSQYLEGDDVRAERARKVVRDIVAGGHLVGNHTKNHRLLTAIPRSEAVAQIDEDSDALERTLGKKPILFRPPFGVLDTYTRGVVHDRGLELVLWSVEAADMKNDDAKAMAKSLRKQIEYAEGGIVLLHDIRPATLPTLKLLLEHLHQKRWRPEEPEKIGYQIVDLPTYFALTEASPRPYANREGLENARREAHKSHPELGPTNRGRGREGAGASADGTNDGADADLAVEDDSSEELKL